jgi:AcrR family transcriptional regulator
MAELDKDRIATAALRVANKHGVEGFTMRAVAEALDVTPMALYHHVQDKAALVTLIVDTAIRKHPFPHTTGIWQDDLLAVARWTRQGMVQHPVVAQLRRLYNVWTPSMLQLTERWLIIWQQSGLELQDAMLAASTSSMAINGLVKEEMLYRTLKFPDEKTLAWLPHVRRMFAAKPNRDAQFDLVVQSLIEGLHARLNVKRSAIDRDSLVELAVSAARRAQSRKPNKRNKS